MKKICQSPFLLFILYLFSSFNTNAQGWVWARSSNDSNSGFAYSCTPDKLGNVYVTGTFFQYLTLGSATLICAGNSMFLAKYNAIGNVIWATSASDTDHDNTPYSIAVDNAGNVYVVGSFSSPTITFDTTTLVNTSGGSWNLFIVKYNSSGNVIWARTAVTTGIGASEPSSVAIDTVGNIYVTGYYCSASVIFDSLTLTNIVDGLGANNMFLVKFNSNGNALWARNSVPLLPSICSGNSVAVDHSGNIIAGGTFSTTTVTFDTITLTGAGSFLVKYDAAGNVIWAKKVEGIMSVATDQTDDIYITGCTATNNTLLAKYTPSGNILWTKYAGGSSDNCGFSVCVDTFGNVFIMGQYYSPAITFGPFSLFGVSLPGLSFSSVFLAEYQPSGNVIMATTVADTFDVVPRTLSINQGGDVYVCGRFDCPTVCFGYDTLINADSIVKIFIAKYAYPLSVPEVKQFDHKINIYPNPANNQLTITATETINQITITNLIGQTIYTNIYNTEKAEVDVSALPAGIYFVKVNGGSAGLTMTRKFVKE